MKIESYDPSSLTYLTTQPGPILPTSNSRNFSVFGTKIFISYTGNTIGKRTEKISVNNYIKIQKETSLFSNALFEMEEW